MKSSTAAALALLAPSAATAAQGHWQQQRPATRLMNGTNFPGHNVKHAGCDPVVTTQHTTPTKCQAACDADRACDMWTFVSTAHKSPPGAGAPPWCCLKACDGGACPEPETEAGCVSGAKDPAKYNRPPPPAPPPAPCVGADCFTFTADWASGSAATTLTTGNFSVRKTEFMYYPPDGRTYAYCDIVNFTDFCEPKPPPHHHHPATHKPCGRLSARRSLTRLRVGPTIRADYPDSYSSEVGVFSSPDGRSGWQYHGIVIPRGKNGSWDGGGIASPGAATAKDGTVIVGYAGEQSPAGGINRGIGV